MLTPIFKVRNTKERSKTKKDDGDKKKVVTKESTCCDCFGMTCSCDYS